MVVKEKGAWIQCQECGHIYYIEENVKIDQLYITSYCPRCDGIKGLNLGDNQDDLYMYTNVTMDPRYYEY